MARIKEVKPLSGSRGQNSNTRRRRNCCYRRRKKTKRQRTTTALHLHLKDFGANLDGSSKREKKHSRKTWTPARMTDHLQMLRQNTNCWQRGRGESTHPRSLELLPRTWDVHPQQEQGHSQKAHWNFNQTQGHSQKAHWHLDRSLVRVAELPRTGHIHWKKSTSLLNL